MKKAAMGMGILLATVLATAGGDLAPAASTVAPVASPCSTDTVYVDRDSKLMWQDALYTDAEDGAYIQNRSFGKAGSEGYAVQYCQRLDYAGYSDWRLPTADELMAIHHHPDSILSILETVISGHLHRQLKVNTILFSQQMPTGMHETEESQTISVVCAVQQSSRPLL